MVFSLIIDHLFIYSHDSNHKEQHRMIWQGYQKKLFNVIEEMTAERNENTSGAGLDIFEVEAAEDVILVLFRPEVMG